MPMTGYGKATELPKLVELALSSAIVSYIQLENARMKKISYRKQVIQKIKLCLDVGEYKYQIYDHLYNRMMRKITDQVDASDDNYKME